MKARLALLITFALIGAACATGPATHLVFADLTQREQVPATGTGHVKPLRVAVAAILSPEGNIESYGALADYLGTKLARPVEIVQRRTYQEVNDLLENGSVDVAFVCTSAYVAGHDRFGLRLLAAPQIDCETVYYSTLIISAESIADLRGARFALGDPIGGRTSFSDTLVQVEKV